MPTSTAATNSLRRLTSDWDTAGSGSSDWQQFLSSIRVTGLRGWNGEPIDFRFPIVALAGENGSGKSTILKAAASAYINSAEEQKTLNPDDFFPATQWETVAGVRLEYRYRQGDNTLARSVRKPTKRWIGLPDRPRRHLYFLDITRTQPIDSLIGYGKIAKAAAFGESELELNDDNRSRLSRVLRREYEASKLVLSDEAGKRKQVGVVTRGGVTYSNFHQGAGEDSTVDLIALLQAAPAQSLIVVDEVEASLHPRAQRRLIGEMFELARTKRLQFILSTHSTYILDALPEAAKVYIQPSPDGRRNLLYGVSANLALTLMDDERHPDLVLYLEDERAAHLCFAFTVTEDDTLRDRVEFLPVGPANVVKALGLLVAEDKLGVKALCVLDADETDAPGCIRLPGTSAPEVVVFNAFVEADWAPLAARLGGVNAGSLKEAVQDAMNISDHHLWPTHVADALGGTLTRRRVWEEFAEYYAQEKIVDAVRRDFVDLIRDALAWASRSARTAPGLRLVSR